MNNFRKNFISYIKKHKLISAIAILVAIVSLGALIPLSMSDGLDKFTGAEQRVAAQELSTYIEFSTTGTEKIGSLGIFRYRVEHIKPYPVPSRGMYSTCERAYEIFITERTFFGFHPAMESRIGCTRYQDQSQILSH